MPLPQLKSLSKKANIPVAKIEKEYYPKALKIAKDMGMEGNYAYIFGVLENMLGIEESIDVKALTNKYLENDKSFKDFIDEEIVSSDITTRPEKAPKCSDPSTCMCTKCGYEEKNDNSTPCKNKNCPKCNTNLIRK